MGDKNYESHRTKSKSRSKSRKEFVSRNPFVNFLRDFKQQPEVQNKSQAVIFKMAGERWRNMSDSEKAPYINAAREVRDKEPRVKRSKGHKKGGNTTKNTTDKNKKKIKKRKCSNCGHRHGSTLTRGDSTDSLDKEEYDDDDEKTSVESDSRSRSRSRSKSGSGSTNGETNVSDSSTTY